ncbi:GntR family transcriptional regulator [Salipiger sp. PrR002]|uniref:GntR family transcriptional regulator n=1 Tax=Salipiger sp. PrR002 TaxID=2706489 RepID=UPI0013B67F8D|nr:GntR family transcriptional regulator [Salipiger sp. PrR002]NDW01239.1 GntR family transcriptional regulator [Salipiger sp. PrR002]NDW58117.1 GntR family transcriptional regulator [Salipiger sp. PrR004]
MSDNSRTATRICSIIEQRIASGAYQDGDKLSEVALAEQLEVSRTPLREAFLTLEAIGLVELIPRRGAFVRRPSMTRLVEMFEVMAGLEAWCVRLAAQRITPAQRLYLRRAAQDCEAALKEGAADRYYEANNRLHGMIYEASGNQVLAEEAKRMDRRLRPFRRRQLDVTGRLEKSMQEHTSILDAMERGEADHAAELMRQHINSLSSTYDVYLASLGEDARDRR